MRTEDIKEAVRELLETDLLCRDNDERLVARIWAKEVRAVYVSDFLYNLERSKYTPADQIIRWRQKWQQHNESLCGKKKEIRKAHEIKKRDEFRKEVIVEGVQLETRSQPELKF